MKVKLVKIWDMFDNNYNFSKILKMNYEDMLIVDVWLYKLRKYNLHAVLFCIPKQNKLFYLIMVVSLHFYHIFLAYIYFIYLSIDKIFLLIL